MARTLTENESHWSWLHFEIRNTLPPIQAFSTLILEHYDHSSLPSESLEWLREWQPTCDLWAEEIQNCGNPDIGDSSLEEIQRTQIKKMITALDGIECAANKIKEVPIPSSSNGDAEKCWEAVASGVISLEEKYQRMCKLLASTISQ